MLDPDDAHHIILGYQPVGDSVCAPACGVVSGQLALKRLTEALGCRQQRADHELDHRRSDSLGESSQRALRRRRQPQLPCHRDKYLALSSSALSALRLSMSASARRISRTARGLAYPCSHSRATTTIDESRKDRYRDNADIGLTDLKSPSLDITARDLSAVTIPTLVIAGTTSHPSLRSIARQLATALPNARFVELANCGHVTYAEQPDEFARAVSVFAAELNRRVTPEPS